MFDSLDRIAEDSLLVDIAHRLSTIRRTDKIAYLDDGVLVETGSHDELMQREGGAYRRFVELWGDAIAPVRRAGHPESGTDKPVP